MSRGKSVTDGQTDRQTDRQTRIIIYRFLVSMHIIEERKEKVQLSNIISQI